MQIPQNIFDFSQRRIETRYLSELAKIQSTKNRSYTQLKAGDTQSFYQEANLGNVQVFREKLGAAGRIHAAPPERFIPLAAIIPNNTELRFCGKKKQKDTILQASGAEWDVCFDGPVDYVTLVLDYHPLNQTFQHLYQQELPKNWLLSQAVSINTQSLHRYTYGITHLLHMMTQEPTLFQHPTTCKFIADQAMQLALQTLNQSQPVTANVSSYSRRIQGVYRVIDYLQVHASQLPSIAELCTIALLSERSLEYGFREYLGITPSRYLKAVRLNGVRKTLLNSNQFQIKVCDAAMQWGFLELGRFAKEYQQLFNELPSDTLKKSG